MNEKKWAFSLDVSGETIFFSESIGKGSFGEVWSAVWCGSQVAAKTIHEKYFKKEYDPEIRDFYIGKLRNEWEVLHKLVHPNVVRMYSVLFPPHSLPIIVMELMHRDLLHYIENSTSTPKVSPNKGLSIALGIAEGLVYLHAQDPPVVHRDIATKNILLTVDGQPKIADLEVARVFAAGKDVFATARPGTPLYAAPETYKKINRYDQTAKYGPKVDIFSYGVVVLVMNIGHEPVYLPINGPKGIFPETRRRLKDLDEMEEGELKKLVIKCLQDKSPKRPSARKLVTRLKKVEPQRAPAFVGCVSPREEQTNDYEFKVLFLGNHNVGKSALIEKLKNPEYDIDTHRNTKVSIPGIDTLVHYFNHDGKVIKMLVVDTSGGERNFCLTASYYRDVDGVFLVYDISDKVSLRSLPFWITSLRKYNSKDDLQMLLVGNKVDLRQTADADDLVPPGRAIEFASNINSPYVETSVRDAESVQEMYQKMVKILMSTVSPEDADVQARERAGTTLRLPSPKSQNNPEELSRWSSIKFRNKCKA